MSQPIFEGVGTALVTPFAADGSVDYEKLRTLTEFQIENGVKAIIACGTTGEKSTLRHEEHVKVIDTIIKTVAGRIPVVAGTGSNDTLYTLELSQAAQEAGADALLLVTPYYNKTSQSGLIRHYIYVADRIHTPIILYNVPSRTGMNIEPETYAALCSHPNIVATKEANGNFSALAKTVQLCGDRLTIYSGNDEHTIPMIAMGAKGVISVASNFMPEPMALICQKALQGNFTDAMTLQNQYFDVFTAMFADVNPIPVKEAMNQLGMQVGDCRMPLFPADEKVRTVIRHSLQKAGIMR